MNYPDGKQIRVGDKVRLGGKSIGVVVASLDTHDYSPDYGSAEWSELKKGILVKYAELGLVHHEEPEEELELLQGPIAGNSE